MNLLNYFNTPCKFRLKDGKEIYGVIWKEEWPQDDMVFFSTVADYNKFQKSIAENNNHVIGYKLNSQFKILDVKNIIKIDFLPDEKLISA